VGTLYLNGISTQLLSQWKILLLFWCAVKVKKTPNDPYSVTQSVMPLTKLVGPWDPSHVMFEQIIGSKVVFEPTFLDENYGTEDPRVVYREKTGEYFLLYSAVQQYPDHLMSRLALAVTKTPAIKSSWKRYGPLFPEIGWSKSGAMLIRDQTTGPHYLIFGDSSLWLATSTNLVNWTIQSGPFLKTRSDNFDSFLVEAGPMPLPLKDGNYLFIYNSARTGYPSNKPGWDIQYNVGYLILDKNDPSKILERSDSPILSPILGWENGTSPYLDYTPNVVFIEGWLPNGDNSFIAFYGAADSVIGVGIITVTSTEDE